MPGKHACTFGGNPVACRAGIAAIALGSATTALVFALLAHFVGAQAETFLKNPVLAGVSTLVLLFVAWRAYLRFLHRLRS